MTDGAFLFLTSHYVTMLKKHLKNKWNEDIGAREIITSALFRLAYDEGLIGEKNAKFMEGEDEH